MNINEKSITKKIMIVIVIVMLYNFVMPNYIFAEKENASDVKGGGVIFKYGVPLLLMMPDLLLQKLQNIFIDEDAEIAIEDPKGGISNYSILYSPGVIFSGKVPGLDVNFISPMGDENGVVVLEREHFKYEAINVAKDGKETNLTQEILKEKYGLDLTQAVEGTSYSDISTYVLWFGRDVAHITWVDDNDTEDTSDDVKYWYHKSTTANMPLIMYIVGGLMVVGGLLAAIKTRRN